MSGLPIGLSNLRRVAAVGAFAACMALGGTAHAALFGIHGTFDDGATLSGSFSFNQNCSGLCGPSAYSDINITTTTASILGATYDGPATFGSSALTLAAAELPNILGLIFPSLKGLTSGSVSFAGFETGPEATPVLTFTSSCGFHCGKPDIEKRLVEGKIWVVPVPAALPILLTGVAGLFGLRLRRRRETSAA